jgi:hypothetical protein
MFFAPPPKASYGSIGKPSEIARQVCTIVKGQGGKVVQ